MTFAIAGGRPVTPRGGDLVATRTNYFVGERSRWRTNVPNFGQVRYTSVRDGIDVVYHGEGGVLEYDIVVAPQADPAAAAIDVGGTEGLALMPNGDLAIQTPSGRIFQPAPHVYQTIHGRREEVHGAYRIAGKSSIGFEVARYDRDQPLIIDPVLSYATYLNADYGFAVAADGAGNAYVVGETQSLGLGTPGADQAAYDAGSDAYVAKLDPSGSSLVYATYLGGSQFDEAYAVAVDASGHAYVTGKTGSTDFPTTNALQGIAMGSVFVTELAPDGASLVYSTRLGGGSDTGSAIAVDPTGRAYVTGTTYAKDFPVTSGLYPFSGTSSMVTVSNAFIVSIAAGGATLEYGTCLGGEGNVDYDTAQGRGIAVDAAGNAYVEGYANPNGFPVKNSLVLFSSLSNMFVTEVAAGGGSLVFSTFLEPAASAGPNGIAVDSGGNIYVTGGAGSQFTTTTGAAQTTCPQSGGGCAFIEKLAPSGASVVYATVLGGSAGAGTSGGIVVDAAGTAYVAGVTSSSDFPLVNALSGPTALFQKQANDGFVTAIDKTGGSFDYSTHIAQQPSAIAVDGAGNAFVAGTAESSASAFATCGALQTGTLGPSDAFVLRIAREGQPDAGPAECGPADGGTPDAGGAPTDAAASVDAAASDDASTAGDAGETSPSADAAVDASRPAQDADDAAAPRGDAGSSGSGSPFPSCQTSVSGQPGSGSPMLWGTGLAVALVLGSRRRSRR